MESYGNIRIPWNGWRIESRLGSGSFGTVYEIVRDTYGTVEKSAMKVISVPENSERLNDLYSSGLDDESLSTWCTNRIENILKEYGVMNSLKGKANIVNCEDIEVVPHDNDPGADIFIRMELLTSLNKLLGIIQKKEDKLTDDERETLRKLRPDHKEFTEEDVIKLGKDISQAIEICEKNNIVHRDIKPENILISDDGDFKLGDFGTARKMEHTTAATLAGTERYMAPEVIKGGQTGRDVDTYSLGLVMYRLLNRGRFPFYPMTGIATAEQTEEAQRRRLAGEPFDPPVDGSPELKSLVMKACSYDRNDRFSSAAEMMEKIEEAEEIAEERAERLKADVQNRDRSKTDAATEHSKEAATDFEQANADSAFSEHAKPECAKDDSSDPESVGTTEDAWTDDSEKTLGSQPLKPAVIEPEEEDRQEQELPEADKTVYEDRADSYEEKNKLDPVADSWADIDETLAKPKNEFEETADTIDKFTVGDVTEKAQTESTAVSLHAETNDKKSNSTKIFIGLVAVVLIFAAALVMLLLNNSQYKKYTWDGITITLPSEWSVVSKTDDEFLADDETNKEWEYYSTPSGDEFAGCKVNILDRDHNKYWYKNYLEFGPAVFIEDHFLVIDDQDKEVVPDIREIEIDNTTCCLGEFVFQSSIGNHHWIIILIPFDGGKWITKVEISYGSKKGTESTQDDIVNSVINSIKKANDSGHHDFEITAEDIWHDTTRWTCDGISFETPADWHENNSVHINDLNIGADVGGNSTVDISVDTDDYVYREYVEHGGLQQMTDSWSESMKKTYDVSDIKTGQINIDGNPAYFRSIHYYDNDVGYKYNYELFIMIPDKKQVTCFKFDCEDKGMYTDRDLQLLEYIKQSIRLSD